jgi:hypothetical protein
VSRIEVRIAQRGSVRDGTATRDAQQAARCDLCQADVDAVASTHPEGGGPFACKSCLRSRLEAMTVGTYLLREDGDGGLPWGKVSG